MIDIAMGRAAVRGLEGRVHYEVGDFVALHAALPEADITLLDRVVCCDARPKEMLAAAARRTRRAIALVFPRKHFLGELLTALWNFGFWLVRSDFRSYVHDPAALDRWLRADGLHRSFEHRTLLWHAWVYVFDARP
jgi:magnesium-protoporphyrin O-methyltransferase